MARWSVKEALGPDVARRIRLVILDVDGVLTDGGIYVGATKDGTPVELKRFDITDQLGVKMLVWAGLNVVMLTGRPSAGTRMRAEELGVPFFEAPGGYKLEIVEQLQEKMTVEWSEIACLCDDLADLPLLRRAGLGVAVSNAVREVRAAAQWTTLKQGGHGAVREFAETLLRARGEWNASVERYVAERESIKSA
jgi:3-deoxy-D-manno-octulosonate 8-phosphate phosphatase (KDO 8-P phosphatase)